MIPITWAGPVRWWNPGRADGGQILWIVVHQTEGHGGATAAEDGVAYDKMRPDSVSCHVMVDTNSALREVQDKDTAYAAFFNGNAHGIQVELCHVGGWDLGRTEDALTFDNGAQVVAQLALANKIPGTRLSVAQVSSKFTKGVCDHYDVTRAFPADGGDHTDVDFSGGQPTGFDWPEFMRRVSNYMIGGKTTMRFVFSGLPNTPDGVDGRVHITDGLRYRVQGQAFQVDNLLTTAGCGPITNVTTASVPTGWDYARAVSQLCGTADPGELSGSGASGGLTESDVAAIVEEKLNLTRLQVESS